jgi:hypothetical protein
VSPNGQLLSRRGRSLPADASGFDTHRDSISSRFECSSQSSTGSEARARAEAVAIAAGFWDGRARMQATPGGGDAKPFLPLPAAVAAAQAAVDAGAGTVILTDAADATSSGASGECVSQHVWVCLRGQKCAWVC